MNVLSSDIIYYINEFLVPRSYVSFISSGYIILNSTNDIQYERKKIMYFKSRDINIDRTTIFLSLSDKLIENYEITNSGNYIFIGNSNQEKKISIKGNHINVNFNKKNIICKKNNGDASIIIEGSNITVQNGFIFGTNTILVTIRNSSDIVFLAE